jgi:hypothetical protein
MEMLSLWRHDVLPRVRESARSVGLLLRTEAAYDAAVGLCVVALLLLTLTAIGAGFLWD